VPRAWCLAERSFEFFERSMMIAECAQGSTAARPRIDVVG
jgi:hypothetical protein